MLELITSTENMPFTVALSVMIIIGLLEGVGMLFGAGLSDIISSLLPDTDVDVDADINADANGGADISATNALSKILSWLRVGEVPVIVLLVIFLTSFGLTGLTMQNMFAETIGYMLPAAIASIPALLLSLPITRFFGGITARVIPKDETDAVSKDTFIGRVATIITGTSKVGLAAEAKVKDQHGQIHYIMVEPDNDGKEFSKGKDVLIVRKAGSIFYIIENTNTSMSS